MKYILVIDQYPNSPGCDRKIIFEDISKDDAIKKSHEILESRKYKPYYHQYGYNDVVEGELYDENEETLIKKITIKFKDYVQEKW